MRYAYAVYKTADSSSTLQMSNRAIVEHPEQMDIPNRWDYAVVVTQNGCSDTSVCLNVTGIGINNYPKSPTIQIYPNPVTEKLYIESEDIFQNAKIRLLDITGRVVMEFTPGAKNKTEIDISTLVSGIYFVNISNQESNFSRKIIKR